MEQILSTLDMTEAEWQALRMHSIGSSECGAVLGLNPYKTPLGIWMEKVGMVEPEDETFRMRFGRLIEPMIAEYMMEETGLTLQQDNKIRYHPDYDFLSCNLDRLVLATDNHPTTGIAELKTVSDMAMQKWEDDIPTWYYCQLQHQLMITGYDVGYFGILVFGFAGPKEFKVLSFPRDHAFINEVMLPHLVEFWTVNVAQEIAPDVMTQADINALWPDSKQKKSIEANTPVIQNHRAYCELKAKIKDLQEKAEHHKIRLEAYMEDAERLEYNGRTLATYKTNKNGRRSFRFKDIDPEELWEPSKNYA